MNIEIAPTFARGCKCARCFEEIPKGMRCWKIIVLKVNSGGILAGAASFLGGGKPTADEDICLRCMDDIRRTITAPEAKPS